jgi:hypothetical protein
VSSRTDARAIEQPTSGSQATFDGAWHRRSLAVAGFAVQRDTMAVWVQAGRWFVDLRRGRTTASAVAGRTTWETPVMTWHHLLDNARARAAVTDVGVLEHRTGGELVERGRHRGVPFVEVWRRSRRPDALRAAVRGALTEPDGVACRCDDLIVVVARSPITQAVCGSCWSDVGGSWRLLWGVGEPCAVPRPLLEVDRADPGDGWQAVAGEGTP